MSLEVIDRLVCVTGGLLAYTTLAMLFFGIWRGIHRQTGRTTGQTGVWLRSPWFYLVTSVFFFSICYLSWKPIPLAASLTNQAWMLVLGSVIYFPGMSLVIWARLSLGDIYFPSTGLGVQLFAGHRLVTRGPFALLRHPMYAGLICAAVGSLLIYLTWTTLFLACFTPLITLRARREEAALAMEFGEQWETYCQRVPMWIPRKRRL